MIQNILNSTYQTLSSPIAIPLIAIIAAVVTLGIYFLRRHDYKMDAANIILLEIQSAEKNIDEAKKSYESGRAQNPSAIVFPEYLRLMKTESWTKYKYLFVRNFSQQQWEEIGNFYDNCLHYDEAVEHKDSTFGLNEADIRAGIQSNISKLSLELAREIKPNPDNNQKIKTDNDLLLQKYQKIKEEAVLANIRDLLELYNPDKSFRDAAYFFNLLPTNLVNTPTGTKLQKLAKKRIIGLF